MRLKLCTACPLERRVKVKVKWIQLHQIQKPIGQDPPLHCPEITQTLFVLSSHDEKEGTKGGNKAFAVDCKESESVNPLGVAPCEREKDLMGRLTGLCPGFGGKVDGGVQQANVGLGRLIVPCT